MNENLFQNKNVYESQNINEYRPPQYTLSPAPMNYIPQHENSLFNVTSNFNTNICILIGVN